MWVARVVCLLVSVCGLCRRRRRSASHCVVGISSAQCAEHAPLNAVDWSSNGFYNAELSGALNGASKACASAECCCFCVAWARTQTHRHSRIPI